MQYLAKTPLTIYMQLVSGYNLQALNATRHHMSENCLTPSGYAPSETVAAARASPLPVSVFVHDGAFVFSGQDIPYEILAAWVHRLDAAWAGD